MEIQFLADNMIAEANLNVSNRFMIAIAGPPASGKSTFADKLCFLINQKSSKVISEVIPMDGFHFDNETLDELKLRHRKGAENTLDSKRFIKMLEALKGSNETISIPLFDRAKDTVIPEAKIVTPEVKILIVEGNYLLVEDKPWSKAHKMYDFTVFLKPNIETVKKRLIDRWMNNGYDLEGARHRALSNDIPNSEMVIDHSIEADLMIV